MGDTPLWGIIGAFVAWEAYAHFVARNKASHTLSNRIDTLEQRYPTARVGVAVAILALFAHLVLNLF
jgi:hypothetical protein